MSRQLAYAVSAALLLVPLAGCGDDHEAYCSAVRSAKSELAGVRQQGLTSDDLARLNEALDEISRTAPKKVEDEWRQISRAFTRLESALRKAGVSFEDLRKRKVQRQLGEKQRRRVLDALVEVRKVGDADQTVSDQVREACDIELGSAR